LAVALTQLSLQWIAGSFSLEVKQQVHKATTNLNLVLKLTMTKLYFHFPYVFVAWFSTKVQG
jgi:hypothetical protein